MDYQALLAIAYREAKKSRDTSTQNAALLVDAMDKVLVSDVNRLPYGVHETLERLARPLKYKVTEHAERNACYGAARFGIRTQGLTMVCPWAPCTDCARAIIQCGINRLVTHKQALERTPDFWKEDIALALRMLEEAGVEVVTYDGVVGVEGLLHSGQIWNP